MANKGYPDDDGSRTPAGPHDESPRGAYGSYGIWDVNVARMMRAATVANMIDCDDGITNGTDTSGARMPLDSPYPVDGDANTNPRGRSTADYPPFNSMG